MGLHDYMIVSIICGVINMNIQRGIKKNIKCPQNVNWAKQSCKVLKFFEWVVR